MKVAIVEDFRSIVEHMVRAAEEAGHMALGVHIGSPRDPKYMDGPDKIQCHTRNLDEAVAAVKAFEPDVVFIDHELELGNDNTGAHFAQKLGMPREKYIGISGSYAQSYCAKKMWGKDWIYEKGGEARKGFLALLS